jgi:nucleoside triphosphate pyrophosphatase
MSLPDLYLASASPRRRELLAQINVQVEVVPQSVPEQWHISESPEDYVQRLALEKARAGYSALGENPLSPVLGADTAVVVDDTVLGKPVDKADALVMLGLLSGRSHRVLSALAVVGEADLGQDKAGYSEAVRLNDTRVHFRHISEAERLAYWRTGEPADKAGAYGIQGMAALFIEHIEGSYSAVVGLPLCETGELLRLFGVEPLHAVPYNN